MLMPIVIKVGGSLYDWPDLGPRLRDYLDCLRSERVLLIPGGGPMVDVLRDLDRQHRLGDETSHALALRILAVNASWLASVLVCAETVESLEACIGIWERRGIPILDCDVFLHAAGERETGLPHSWNVTSDSIAAHVARRAGARRLVLLKSTADPTHGDWIEAGRQGFVDPWFARIVGPDLAVEAVNLRRWQGCGSDSPAPLPGE